MMHHDRKTGRWFRIPEPLPITYCKARPQKIYKFIPDYSIEVTVVAALVIMLAALVAFFIS